MRGDGDWELLFNGIEFLFGVMKRFWKWIVAKVAQHCKCT